MSCACACAVCDREFSSMEAFYAHITSCRPAESWYDRTRRELGIRDELRTPSPTVETSPTVDPAGAGEVEAAGIEPAFSPDRKPSHT